MPEPPKRAVRPNPRGVGAPIVTSTELSDEDVEYLFSARQWPRNGLRCTLEEARSRLLSTRPGELPAQAKERIEAAGSWQALVRAVYEAVGEMSPWAYELHRVTGLHADFLAYIAYPKRVPGPFPFYGFDDDQIVEDAAWPWTGADWGSGDPTE